MNVSGEPPNGRGGTSKNDSCLYGLMPDPKLLKAYEGIDSREMLDWWKKLVETEQNRFKEEMDKAHEIELKKIDLERERLNLQANEVKRGQFFGLLIGILALLAGSIASIGGAPVSGGFIGTGGVIGLVTVFVLGRTIRKDRDRNA
jgi:uncharacterized membrane protein